MDLKNGLATIKKTAPFLLGSQSLEIPVVLYKPTNHCLSGCTYQRCTEAGDACRLSDQHEVSEVRQKLLYSETVGSTGAYIRIVKMIVEVPHCRVCCSRLMEQKCGFCSQFSVVGRRQMA